MDIRLEISTN